MKPLNIIPFVLIAFILPCAFSGIASAQQENFKLLFHAVGPDSLSGLGSDMTAVGDWNHDGWGDVFSKINQPNFVRLYYGSEPMDTIPDMYFYEGPCYDFGDAPAYSQSFSGDNYSDFNTQLTIGSFPYSTQIELFYFGSNPPDSLSDYSLIGESIEGCVFGAFSSFGDINGDGFDDFGTSDVNYGTPFNRGKIYIYYGGVELDTIPDLTITGEPNNFGHGFGLAVSVAGDVNNDGYNDIFCISHPSPSSIGGAYLFLGSAEPDSTPFWYIPTNYPGYSIADEGGIVEDLNGDGYDDIAVGSTNSYTLIFFGGETISTTHNLTLFSGLDYADDIESAGDVNNDGYGDIISADFSIGRVYVYYGGNPMDDDYDLMFYAASWEAGCAGDVNGDGVDDLMYFSQYVNGGSNGQIFIWGDTTHTSVNKPQNNNNPIQFNLNQNYPNPFNACTGISFYTGNSQGLDLKIYNIRGQEVYFLHDDSPPGTNVHLVWSGRNQAGIILPSGVYFIELSDGKQKQVKKMEILR